MEVQRLKRIGYSDVLQVTGEMQAIAFSAGMTIDADGAYRAYHPNSAKGLDYLANAGKPGNWWALVTHNGKPSGIPVIQKANDPAPGYYISTTSLQDEGCERIDPRRYVDSESIPFFVLPKGATCGAELGDFGYAIDTRRKTEYGCVFADIGPKDHIGEGSIALARALGIPFNPRKGGTVQGVVYMVFPGSGSGWPLSNEEIQEKAGELFGDWGGMEAAKEIFPHRF